jgi:hypothetical protein
MKYNLTNKDYYKAYLLNIKPRKIYSILGIFLICIGLFACLVTILSAIGKSGLILAGVLFLCIIVCLSAIYILPLYTINKSYKQTKGIGDDIELTVNEESFSISGNNFNIKIPYENIYKIRSNDSYLLVYENQYFYRIIAKTDNDLKNAAKIIEDKYKTPETAKTSIVNFVMGGIFILALNIFLGFIIPALSPECLPHRNYKPQKEIASMIRSLQDSDSLKIHNEFRNWGDEADESIVKEDIEINKWEVIDEVAGLLSSVEYVVRSSYPHSTRIGSEEFIEVYVYKDGTQTHTFRVIGNILEINEDLVQRYECSDEDFMTKLREVVHAGGDWLGTRY